MTETNGLRRAVAKARMEPKPLPLYRYPIQAPQIPDGVVPKGITPQVAMDASPAYQFARFAFDTFEAVGFPGYPHLAALSTRAEYRMFAQAMSTQITREWIAINSTETAGNETKQKCVELTQMITDLGLKQAITTLVEHDSFYGRAQLGISLGNQDKTTPLILSPKTIEKRTLKDGVNLDKYFRISPVEAIWTTPLAYDSLDALSPNFYKPSSWFVLGQEIHSTRLLTVITRQVSDMFKPAFNFGGMSMSQLAEPYVDNWLRTRQSVADLINNFSIVTLATSMDQALQAGGDVEDLAHRADFFTLTRSNKGLMLLDKEREELSMFNVPIGGLSQLQAQSQEQMCSVGHTPAVFLLGIAPSGFGNVAEGEIRAFYDWVAALQETYWRKPIEIVINILQLIRYGSIDSDIVMSWQPLFQMTPKELAEIRRSDADTDGAYIDRGAIDVIEVREKLARDPESGYQGIDTSKIPIKEDEGENPDESPQELENNES